MEAQKDTPMLGPNIAQYWTPVSYGSGPGPFLVQLIAVVFEHVYGCMGLQYLRYSTTRPTAFWNTRLQSTIMYGIVPGSVLDRAR